MRRRVLVVDDDAQILEVLDLRLTAMGLEVVVTTDPEHALRAAAASRFDVALLDLRMEPMDGILLMEALHAEQGRLPVIIMTAHGTIETAVDAVQRGAFDYLTKPFVRDELRSKINRALSVRRWARDRERLLSVGEILASSGNMERVLDAVASAALETIEAECCVVFQLDQGQLVPMAKAGAAPPSWEELEEAASAAMRQGIPTTQARREGGLQVAAPLVVERGPAGALVIQTTSRVEPSDDDLELLALFSAQAAVAIRNTHELERLRSGALTALGRMATQVAHELKNPLAGLLLYSRHLEHRLARNGDGEGADVAGKISTAVERLAAVVSEITAFGRPPELHLAQTALQPLLEECLTFAHARHAGPPVEVVRAYDGGCPDALLDARELRKAFLNLILNAFEALPDGGRLAVGTAYSADSDTITVVIEDSGVGMSEETLSRVYDMFFTTKPEGTGLGMAIARSVIALHRGDVSIQSRLGHGTRVSVRLPVHVRAAEATAAEASP